MTETTEVKHDLRLWGNVLKAGGHVMRKKGKEVRTAEQVKEDFLRKGASVSSWAVNNGFAPAHVFNVLAGRNRGVRGKAHKIAVLLGMKDGEIVS